MKLSCGPRLRNRGRGFTHAEADLEDRRRASAEQARDVERLRVEWNPESGEKHVERALLRERHPALAQHETAHGAAVGAPQ